MNDSRLSDSIFGGDDERRRTPAARRKLPGGSADGQEAESPSAHSSASRPRANAGRPRRSGASEEDLTEQARRERRTEKVPPMSRTKAGASCLLLVVLMVLGLGAGGYALLKSVGHLPSFAGGSNGDDMPDFTGEGSGSIDVTVNPGDSGYAIGQTLESAGVVKSARTFATLAGADPRFSKIQAGSYRMRRNMSSQAAMNLMLDPKSHVSGGIVIREGLWSREIFAILSKKTGTPLADYSHVDPSKLGLPPAANNNVEGYLFPATYTFPKHTSAQQQLRTMVELGNQARGALHIPEPKLHDVMTEASIVQAEAGPADMNRVARVIDNRLKPNNSETYGRLQMDSTIHFILHKRGSSKVSTQDTKIDNPYNTYQHAGLPPGPINNPGLAAIKAAQNPAPGTWYYFVTVNMDTGETLFADTLPEQQRNEAKYRQWCSDHPGRC